jgi:hypothetical protein
MLKLAKEKLREEKRNISTKNLSLGKPIPDDFTISDEVRKWFGNQRNAYNLEGHFTYFVSQAKAKGYLSSNWDEYFKIAVSKNWAKIEKPEYMRGLSNPVKSI